VTAVAATADSAVSDAVSPVRGAVRVIRRFSAGADAPQARTEVPIAASEPVFEGHYPDFPIFPGVCVVECVHRSALATAPAGTALTLASLDSARFVGAVFGGDVLGIDIAWTALDDGWKCDAVASTDRGVAAKVRLRYATGVPA
jgi:3-hydroxyacyl-[acyl-carrier-protein] dehydratase